MRLIPSSNRLGFHLAWTCVVLTAFIAGRVSAPINRDIPSNATVTHESTTASEPDEFVEQGSERQQLRMLSNSEQDQFGVIASAAKDQKDTPIVFGLLSMSSFPSVDGRQIFSFTMGLER